MCPDGKLPCPFLSTCTALDPEEGHHSRLVFIGFCKNKLGRALQAQAAAGIDAAATEDDLLNQHEEGAKMLDSGSA